MGAKLRGRDGEPPDQSNGDDASRPGTLARESSHRASSESDATVAPDMQSGESIDSFLRAVAAEDGDSAPLRTVLRAGVLLAGRYRLERPLGEGGMGIVWEASHTLTRRRVALKFLKGLGRWDDELRRRFVREARVATALRHPNVIEVLDVFQRDGDPPVMVMEFLPGETLSQRLSREKRLSLEQLADVLLPVVSAVGTAHSLGIVHRDLKPANIFLFAGGDPNDVKVLDFGVAKLMSDQASAEDTDAVATRSGTTLGTPCYMAPEQALGRADVDHRADIWALGAIIYECLAGRRPVRGSNVGQVVMQLTSTGIEPLARVMSGLPPAVADLVDRMTAYEPSARPSSLQQVWQVLVRYTNVRPPAFREPAVWSVARAATPAADCARVSKEPAGDPVLRADTLRSEPRQPPEEDRGSFSTRALVAPFVRRAHASRAHPQKTFALVALAAFIAATSVHFWLADGRKPRSSRGSAATERAMARIDRELASKAPAPSIAIGPDAASPDGHVEQQSSEPDVTGVGAPHTESAMRLRRRRRPAHNASGEDAGRVDLPSFRGGLAEELPF